MSKREKMWKFEKNSTSAVDWSEFHVWCYLTGDIKKHNRHKHCSHGLPDTLPCPTCIGSNSILKQKYEEILKRFRDRDTALLTHRSATDTLYTQFVAGALGGVAATYSTHWLDTVKVRMQTFPGSYANGFVCFRSVLKESGISGLYQGAGPAVLGHAFKAAFVFMSYGLSTDIMRMLSGYNSEEQLGVWQHASAGAMTGVAASLFICPLELVKCRMQALHQLYCSSKGPPTSSQFLRTAPALLMTKAIVKSEGFTGLYRGLPGMWFKEIPGSFIYFGSYHMAKKVLRYFQEKEHLDSAKVFSCGVFAGLCYCLTHPLESVKTRVQVMSAVTDSPGFLRAFKDIVKSEGFLPLCSGLKTQMIRSGMFSGIQFLIYESTKTILLMRHEDNEENEE